MLNKRCGTHAIDADGAGALVCRCCLSEEMRRADECCETGDGRCLSTQRSHPEAAEVKQCARSTHATVTEDCEYEIEGEHEFEG